MALVKQTVTGGAKSNENEIAAAGGMLKSQGTIESTQKGSIIELHLSGNSAPFSEITKGLRGQATGLVIADSWGDKGKYGVIGPKITVNSGYYQIIKLGKNTNKIGKIRNTDYVHGFSDSQRGGMRKDGKNKYKKWFTNKIFNNTSPYSILPNCIGLSRARYFELTDNIFFKPNNYTLPTDKQIANVVPYNISSWGAVKHSGNTQVITNLPQFKLWKDTNKEYGVKDGLYGWYYREQKGWKAPMVPGCIVAWKASDYSHIAFVEGVFNPGKDNEYAVLSNGSWGKYSVEGVAGYRKVKKISIYSKKGGEYAFNASLKNIKIIYTPLCDFGQLSDIPPVPAGSSPGTQPDPVPNVPDITIDTSLPYEDQTSEYNAMRYATWTMGAELKPGMRVEIQWIGNTKPDGSGARVNRLFGQGWVKSVKDSGMPYRYEIYDKVSNGSLIAYYDRKSLRII